MTKDELEAVEKRVFKTSNTYIRADIAYQLTEGLKQLKRIVEEFLKENQTAHIGKLPESQVEPLRTALAEYCKAKEMHFVNLPSVQTDMEPITTTAIFPPCAKCEAAEKLVEAVGICSEGMIVTLRDFPEDHKGNIRLWKNKLKSALAEYRRVKGDA